MVISEIYKCIKSTPSAYTILCVNYISIKLGGKDACVVKGDEFGVGHTECKLLGMKLKISKRQ